MVVYADVLLLENFIVNFFLIFITVQTLKVVHKYRFEIVSALLGSLYVFTMLISELNFLTLFPFKLLTAFIMILIVFRQKDILFNLKATAIYILYSILLSGMCILIQLSFNNDIYDLSAITNFTYKKLMLAIMVVYILTDRIITYIKDRKEVFKLTYDVEVLLEGKKRLIRAFLDTGNDLREPATNLPVIIVEETVLKDFIPDNIDKYYIPYHVLDGSGGRLLGFKPDYVTLDINGKQKKSYVIIALCKTKINKLNEFNALIPRGII